MTKACLIATAATILSLTETSEGAGKDAAKVFDDQAVAASQSWNTVVGPPKGTLMIVGGNATKPLLSAFLDLAGGPEARIVVIPTAQGQNIEKRQNTKL